MDDFDLAVDWLIGLGIDEEEAEAFAYDYFDCYSDEF